MLYCMDNETAAPPSWARYWAGRIRQAAKKASKTAETTEMWDDWKLEIRSMTAVVIVAR